MKTHYKVLQVGRDAKPERVREIYYDLARKHHPDAGGDVEVFTEIVEAYSVLTDRKKREKYDKKLELKHSQCQGCDGNGQINIGTRTTRQCHVCKGAAFIPKKVKRTK